MNLRVLSDHSPSVTTTARMSLRTSTAFFINASGLSSWPANAFLSPSSDIKAKPTLKPATDPLEARPRTSPRSRTPGHVGAMKAESTPRSQHRGPRTGSSDRRNRTHPGGRLVAGQVPHPGGVRAGHRRGRGPAPSSTCRRYPLPSRCRPSDRRRRPGAGELESEVALPRLYLRPPTSARARGPSPNGFVLSRPTPLVVDPGGLAGQEVDDATSRSLVWLNLGAALDLRGPGDARRGAPGGRDCEPAPNALAWLCGKASEPDSKPAFHFPIRATP